MKKNSKSEINPCNYDDPEERFYYLTEKLTKTGNNRAANFIVKELQFQRDYKLSGNILESELNKFFYREWSNSEQFKDDLFPDMIFLKPESRISRTYDFYVYLQRRIFIEFEGKFTHLQIEHLFFALEGLTIDKYDFNFSFREKLFGYFIYAAIEDDDLIEFVNLIESFNVVEFEILCNLIFELIHNYRIPYFFKDIKFHLTKD